MATNSTNLQSLFEKYMNNSCTKEEWEELLQLVREETHEPNLQQAFKAYWDKLSTIESNPDYWNEKFNEVLAQAKSDSVPVVPIKSRTRWIRWIAAACIILVTGYVLWVTVGRKAEVGSQKSEVAKTNDVPAPANARAVITLADGRKVFLDSVNNGTIAQENNVNVVKNGNGEILYMSPAGGANGEQRTANSPTYNTLFNPRGSKVISLTLSDGTKVWLNSESSLKYPIAFAGNTREVEITGEAYFEVKHNSKQPFKVHLPNGSIVEDIGTSFNINSYSDADNIKTTLIEGSVRVSSSSRPGALAVKPKPGEQVVDRPNSPLTIHHSPDIDEVMSWKNGRFQFSDASIETIMKEVSRYYDAKVVYQEKVPGQFVADISRDVPVSKLLHILELTNRVHFKIEGKKIIVMK